MSQKDEINVGQILEICADDEKWTAWWAQFYTKELKLRATFSVAEFSNVLNLTLDQIKIATPTADDIRLVHALFKYSPERRKTEELSSLKNQPAEGYIESDCIACRKLLELGKVDPETFYRLDLDPFMEKYVSLFTERNRSITDDILHYEKEKLVTKTIRVMGVVMFLISKTWAPKCQKCQQALQYYETFRYVLPCLDGIPGKHCVIGQQGKLRKTCIEELAVFIPVADIPELIANFI